MTKVGFSGSVNCNGRELVIGFFALINGLYRHVLMHGSVGATPLSFPEMAFTEFNESCMTKSKSVMVTRNTSCLVLVIFLDAVVNVKFLLLPLDRYLFRVVIDDRHIPVSSKENVLSVTITESVTVSRLVVHGTSWSHSKVGMVAPDLSSAPHQTPTEDQISLKLTFWCRKFFVITLVFWKTIGQYSNMVAALFLVQTSDCCNAACSSAQVGGSQGLGCNDCNQEASRPTEENLP